MQTAQYQNKEENTTNESVEKWTIVVREGTGKQQIVSSSKYLVKIRRIVVRGMKMRNWELYDKKQKQKTPKRFFEA